MVDQRHNISPDLLARYQRATVIGLGISGFSAVRYLRSCGLAVSVLDSRDNPPLAAQLAESFPDVDVRCGAFVDGCLDANSLIVASPGVSLQEPMLQSVRRQGAQIVGDVALFLAANTKPVIAITGSNGKSTVTTLVGDMVAAGGLRPLVAGNIGVPVLDAITNALDYDVAILELSSFQLETTSHVGAASAAILNISEDHMDRYRSMGDYVLAKSRILKGAQRAILPRHDEQLSQITQVARLLSFELDEPANEDEFGVKRQHDGRWLMQGKKRLMKLSDIALTGLHNVKNVLSAFALTDFLALSLDARVRAVKEFVGLPHRMQTVAMHGGVRWVNDSKATNVGATSTALLSLEQPVIWIAGGQGKGADFTALADAVTDNVQLLILFGIDAPKLEAALNGRTRIVSASDMAEAVALAAQAAKPGQVVLLSPACASFDMYRGFEHRGDTFAACVRNHIERGAA
ncbi:UDP-N-acetylmuramoylalanine--D-glutamate ligase [Arenicella chitinivorans]|uniref:UDP-N-acetylmuramoylalanine--D-glutamate ligase n=1 Tax=Arenicella chitinivorans TaxID=1329800 RepID=A0A918RQ49_9GAMM|nr:UDP-N-acetylmuramoyl-L-alanine--D-glutamate ligase [Arenicella chitinivorans]GHA05858.1 UDP-N-acetylmuramoylalanine--D-glutamate ligase [Arenicella chitinivorans]